MTKVCLVRVSNQVTTRYLERFRELARLDRSGRFELVDSPDAADLTLMTDLAVWGDAWWRLETFSNHPLVRGRHPDLFVYNELDMPWCCYQGLYCSMPRQGFNRFRQRACGYVTIQNPFVAAARGKWAERLGREPKWLFSFAGAKNVPVRARLLGLTHPRGLLQDSSAFKFYDGQQSGDEERQERMRRYVETLIDSKFVLCPRGLGTGSVRLFETMALGRVPVILSDGWVAPTGLAWEEFSLRVPEARAAEVPALLEAAEQRWESMAVAARRAYDEWFAPEVMFGRMIDWCLEIRRSAVLPESVWRGLPDPQQVIYRAQGLQRRLAGKQAGR